MPTGDCPLGSQRSFSVSGAAGAFLELCTTTTRYVIFYHSVEKDFRREVAKNYTFHNEYGCNKRPGGQFFG